MSILSKERIAEITGLHVKETSFGQKHAPAAYSTVYSWEIVELAKMVEALTSQLESVVAENAALKDDYRSTPALRNMGWPKTPATDAFLAEVRASGVEMAAKSEQFSTWVQQGLRSFAIGVRQGGAV